jgi:deazaflavin-dependent oxidoreductase (nitroreductase family)
MTAAKTTVTFVKPSAVEALFNRTFGFLVGLGIGPKFIYLLQVPGRKTGKIYSAPVNRMELGGKLYLVAPRGRANWVRNAEAAGEVTLKRGSLQQRFGLQAIAEEQKPAILKEYLDRYASAVRKFFPIAPGSPVEAFRAVTANYPVYELMRKSGDL